MRLTASAVVLAATLGVIHANSFPLSHGDGLIVVDAVVEGPDERPVSGLRQADFEIAADGEQRQILSFEQAERMSLVLLVDVTNSVTDSGDVTLSGNDPARVAATVFELSLGALRKSAGQLLNGLGRGDRARVGAIAGRLSLSPAFTSDPGELAKAIDTAIDRSERERHGPSLIWDAADAAVSALDGETGRRAVILCTDGRATGNRMGMVDAADHAAASGVSLNIVAPFLTAVIPQGRGVIIVRPERSLGAVADFTGGVLITEVPHLRSKPELVLSTILARVRLAYRLGFAPVAHDGRLHRVDVRVKGEGLTVRARKGYVDRR
ncbi:MAG: hypothetical protein A3G21_14550 [Acidobacteria bacterium RIFCSPLOWO2_12_FULL_66_21]|nr:MAG: hypothetical protein A3G21_14550 [Acidobacteria bacterium RIFCSPLOWO2_12_FULL_66_21]